MHERFRGTWTGRFTSSIGGTHESGVLALSVAKDDCVRGSGTNETAGKVFVAEGTFGQRYPADPCNIEMRVAYPGTDRYLLVRGHLSLRRQAMALSGTLMQLAGTQLLGMVTVHLDRAH